jgi:hypothetical protein
LALLAGLSFGAVMKPDLSADDRPVGPQILAEEPAPEPIDDSLRLTRFTGKIPDYVLGTDWTRQRDPLPPPARREYGDADQEARELAEADEGGMRRVQLPSPWRDAEAAYEETGRAERTVLVASADQDAAGPPENVGDSDAER